MKPVARLISVETSPSGLILFSFKINVQDVSSFIISKTNILQNPKYDDNNAFF